MKTEVSMPLRNAYRPPGDASLWESFLRRLEATIRVAKIHPATIQYLIHPKRSVGVSLPVVMNDGSVQNFTAYRVIHNIARGPALGGRGLANAAPGRCPRSCWPRGLG